MKLMAMDWAGLTCNLRPHAPIIFPPFPNLLPHSALQCEAHTLAFVRAP